MWGVLLIAVSTLATEVGSSLGKYTIGKQEKRVYPIGVIINAGALALFLVFGLLFPADYFAPGLPGGFIFSAASLPYLLPRIALELLQAHMTLLAIARAERSAFGFLRTITLPLLLIVDMTLGYAVALPQVFGVCSIVVGLLFLFINHGIRKTGALLSLFTAFNAVATISLYKYDITHYNSVAAEQTIVFACVVLYFYIGCILTRQKLFALLSEPRYGVQLLLGAVEATAASFAYLFAPASIITSAKRALGVLWSIGAGNLYFHEKHILVKLGAFVFVVGGIFLLAL